MIVLRHFYSQAVLHVSEKAGDVREALFEALTLNVNLRGVDLSRAELAHCGLCAADLQNADLRFANLHRADLRGANLRNANMTGAVLSCADLRGADLTRSSFRFADLRHADISEANLGGADLAGANLMHTRTLHNEVSDADLSPIRQDFNELLLRIPAVIEDVKCGLERGGVDLDGLSEIAERAGVELHVSRPVAQWFLNFGPLDTAANNDLLRLTAVWLDDFQRMVALHHPKL